MSSNVSVRRRHSLRYPVLVCLAVVLSQVVWATVGGAEKSAPTPREKTILDQVERKIVKEPQYASTPRYALLVFGTGADSKVWMVEDGKTLYVDKNANGDLTDDGPPIAPTNVRPMRDFDYLLDEIKPQSGSKHSAFRLARWNYGEQPSDSYGLAVTLDGKTPMYAGWFLTFWSASPETVQPIHFGGPLRPKQLRHKQYAIGWKPTRLSVAFVNNDGGEGSMSRLSIYALPPTAKPVVQIDWPVARGASPLQMTYPLPERCCYWEFYDPNFTVPSGVIPGTAKATISLSEGDFPLELKTNQFEFPVRAEGFVEEGEK